MLHPPIAIIASALLTPLDDSDHSTWHAIRNGREVLDRGHVANHLLYPDTAPLDRLTRIGITVARAASHNFPHLKNLPLFVGTSKGPALSALAFADQRTSSALAATVAAGPAALGQSIGQDLQTSAPIHTSVAACASGLHALHRAVRAIQWGDCDHALVVAADASVHPLFEASFDRLGVLAKPDADGHRRCRPWQNTGFILSEAGAAFLLARQAKQPLGWIDQTTIAADSTHLITLDPHAHSLRYSISQALQSTPVDFVHAHATGTAHDAIEHHAITDLCGPVPIFSSKRWLGHSLGAASLVAAALSLECHRHGITLDGQPAGPRSLTIAQGFGGHIATATLRAPQNS